MTPLVVLGPTASGKSAVASAVARSRSDVELVSVDSMQVYRGMDIGTAKPTAQERAALPHHLLDVAEPSEDFSVVRFQAAVSAALVAIAERGHRAVLVGGTGLYLRAVIDELRIPGQWPQVRAALEAEPDTAQLHRRLTQVDPVAAARMEPTNRRRVVRALEVSLGSGRPFSSFGPGLETYPPTRFHLVGLRVPREVLARRIAARFETMAAAGLVEEVRRLVRDHPGGLSRTARQAVGYRELLAHVEEGVPLEVCMDQAVRRTVQLARRQEVWFRRDPRIAWYDATGNPVAVAAAVLGDWEQRCRP
ncbi:MAG: tRNA (adenosine(37)-N6)-dimethylallyltransferase MiaA [Actinobacteria bacterium]|nr:tRNA (adenosine(37)-N6)-dimethylallyltransferase MiaA [Actinomycetota bacterium]